MKALALILLLPLLALGCVYSLLVYLWFAVVDPAKAWQIAY